MAREFIDYQPDATIFLVACVKTKQPRPMAVKELYTSEWFRRARAFVESTGCPWYVLSAEYGLLYPDDVVAPYERTLKNMGAAERQSWGDRVRRQLETIPLNGKRVVLLAGRTYREPILTYLRSRAASVEVPMEHLSQGRQLQWLGNHAPGSGSESRPKIEDTQTPEPGPPKERNDAILAALFELDERIDREAMIPTLEAGAARLVLEDPYAFLLATCLDRGTRAEIIWTIPTWLQREWGHLDPQRVRRMNDDDIAKALASLPKRPRYVGAAVGTIRELTRIVVDEYRGNAHALWNDRPATEFRFTLERIPGVGPGIASMAVQLVERLFPDELGAGPTAGLDIKPDVHTRRVLYRLGVAAEVTDEAAREAARSLYPEHPGRVDGPLWYIGHTWCHSSRPQCPACAMTELCPRHGLGESSASVRTGPATESTTKPVSRRGRPGKKYRPLHDYLANEAGPEPRVVMSFRQIESILGAPLPASARQYRPWWSNHRGRGMSPQAEAWTSAGFEVDKVMMNGHQVEFRKIGS